MRELVSSKISHPLLRNGDVLFQSFREFRAASGVHAPRIKAYPPVSREFILKMNRNNLIEVVHLETLLFTLVIEGTVSSEAPREYACHRATAAQYFSIKRVICRFDVE